MLIHNYGDNRSPLYVGAALSAAAQSAFVLESISASEAADRQPSNYAFILLSDVNSVPSLLEHSLAEYVRSGGNLFIAAGTSAGARSQIPIFGANIVETRDYNRVPDRSMAVGSSDSSYPAVAKAQGWVGVKFYYALDVDPGDARVIVRLGDQTPLLLEKRIGEGRVLLFTSGLDNLTNDFPLHPAFVPFVEQTARYLAGSERQSGARPVDAYLELRNALRNGKSSLKASRSPTPRASARSRWARPRPRPVVPAHRGRLLPAPPRRWPPGRSRRQPRSQGIEPRRDPRRCVGVVAGQSAGPSGQGSQEAKSRPIRNTSGPAAPRQTPQTLWWYVMLFVLVSAVAESVIASRYLGTQREES